MGSCFSTPQVVYGTFESNEKPHDTNKSDPLMIKLLSYNIFLRPPGVQNSGGDFKNSRLMAFMERIESYDIIGLQEMFCSYTNRPSLLVQGARKKGFNYYVHGPQPKTCSCKLVDSGLTILSKYPITRVQFLAFDQGISSDALALKGILYAQIQITPHHTLNVFNTHLQASYPNTKAQSKLVRHTQVRQINQFISHMLSDQELGKDNAVILMGDFNINAREELPLAENSGEYQFLVEELSGDQFVVQDVILEQLGTHPITFGDVETQIQLDDELIENSILNPKKEIPKDTVLTYVDCYCEKLRLDYIFVLSPKIDLDDDNTSLWKVQEGASQVQPFFVQGYTFGQLSDHYGVETILEYKNLEF